MKQRHRKHRRPVRDPLGLGSEARAALRKMAHQHLRIMTKAHHAQQEFDAAWRKLMKLLPVDPEPKPA